MSAGRTVSAWARGRRRPSSSRSREDRWVASGRRRLTAQVAAAVSLAMVLVGAAAWLIVRHEQARAVDRTVLVTAMQAEDLDDPPADVVLVIWRPGAAPRLSPGAPAAVVDRAEAEATRQDRATRYCDRDLGDDRAYRMVTVWRPDATGGYVVQAAYDLRAQEQERHRLLAGLALAGLLGVALVGAVSVVVGRRAMLPLRAALDVQRRFVTDAAHELRTPLTLLHTRLQVLERTARRTGEPALAAEAGEIVADSRRLADVIEDLLVAAELGHDPGLRVPVDLNAVVRQAAAAARAHAAELGVTLTVVAPGVPELPGVLGSPDVLAAGGALADAAGGPRCRDAPEPPEPPGSPGRPEAAPRSDPVLVLGAEPALRRSVAGLLDNALGHTPAGGTVTVEVGIRADGPSRRRRGGLAGPVAVLRVADNGPGWQPLPPGEPFPRFRHGPAVGGRRRFGLGLALVQEIVDHHGGRIVAGGAPGSGASITITLPAMPRRNATSSGPAAAALAWPTIPEARVPSPSAEVPPHPAGRGRPGRR